MTELNIQQEPKPVNGNGIIDEPKETIEDVKAQLAKSDQLLEDVKKAQSGSDTAVTELKKQNEELRNSLKEKLSDSEREKLELKEKDDRLSNLENDLKEEKAAREKDKLHTFKLHKMAEHKLGLEFADYINGDSESDIESKIEKFKKLKEDELKTAKIKLVDHGEPASGDNDKPTAQMARADFDKLSPDAKMQTMKKGTKII